ncbi:hypothetical protein EXIGLDRAFT_71292 [Exidia glandulosa HHB12029]|uniref:Uncharacterized protein n=1 Tax=Exidia glandulosa HHB12029 TaxID=1314781 RepID=A0A166MJK3_EXIGL|nr:hypothetical protein EXIGLDRAFT_71292 [Exidia glandulosa HHB12029]
MNRTCSKKMVVQHDLPAFLSHIAMRTWSANTAFNTWPHRPPPRSYGAYLELILTGLAEFAPAILVWSAIFLTRQRVSA